MREEGGGVFGFKNEGEGRRRRVKRDDIWDKAYRMVSFSFIS